MGEAPGYVIEGVEWVTPPPKKRWWGPLPIPWVKAPPPRGPSLVVTFRVEGEAEPRQLVWGPDTTITVEQARRAVGLYLQTKAELEAGWREREGYAGA